MNRSTNQILGKIDRIINSPEINPEDLKQEFQSLRERLIQQSAEQHKLVQNIKQTLTNELFSNLNNTVEGENHAK